MAKGKKTGGRDFVKGDPRCNRKGRPREYQYLYELHRDYRGKFKDVEYYDHLHRLAVKKDDKDAFYEYINYIEICEGSPIRLSDYL